MYIEKILQTKYYIGKQDALKAAGYEPACAEDNTANQKCSIKVRAVGLNFEVTKWLEKQSKAINAAYHLVEGMYEGEPKKEEVEMAIKFWKEFKEKLHEHKTD